MHRWLILPALALVIGIAALGCTQPISRSTDGNAPLGAREAKAGEPAAAPAPADRADRPISVQNYLVIGDARLNVIEKTDVPSQRDGQLLYLATEAAPGETVPPELQLPVDESFTYIEAKPGEAVPEAEKFVREEGKDKTPVTYRRLRNTDVDADPMKMIVVRKTRVLRKLREGNEVAKGQLLAVIDPSVAVDEFLNKKVKVDAAKADYEAAIATKKEAEERYNTNKRLWTSKPGTISFEDLRSSQMTFEKYTFEAVAKQAAIGAAERELSQVLTTLRQHEIRAKINGIVKSIQKQTGEAVRNLDTVLQIQDHDRIRVEGEVGIQHLAYLEKGADVVVEPLVAKPPMQVLSGHLQEVRSVAVSKKGLIVSGSDDRTMRVWNRKERTQTVLAHPAEVRAVACTPKGEGADLCLSGDANGVGRIWDLGDLKKPPVPLEEKHKHKNPITTVAFSPDGKWCLTGSVDRTICLWDSSDGKLISRFPGEHRGEVTSVAFLSENEVVSAGSDKAIILWALAANGNATLTERRGGRSHDVPVLGVNPARKQVLFDQGKELRILSAPGFGFDGVLQNPSGAANFTTMAVFSPDGKLVLTAGSSEGRLQLWRAPTAKSRAYELRQLVWPGEAATCGAFSPGSDNSEEEFLVTGTKDRQIVVWEMPDKEEIERELHAKISLLEQSLDSSSRQVRIWAELDNPKLKTGRHRLMPGAPATIVVYPKP